MKKIILTAISILSLVIMVSINSAAADERDVVFGMGESGQTVSFPMTSEEISAFEADNAKLMKIGTLISQTITQSFITFEMGEGGQTFSFPMDPEEIAAEDVAKPQLSEISKKSTAERQPVAYEMAESGVLIEFFKPVFEDKTVSLAVLDFR
jgi:hypothetical protein